MRKAMMAAAGVALVSGAAFGGVQQGGPDDKPVYDVAYEAEANDTFETRQVLMAQDYECFYISGKLQANPDPGRYPDTYLFMYDKFDNVVCEDDNSSSKGNGKASACLGVAPIPNGDDADATIRLGVTGRPDGADNMFNGLFFNAPHGQLGEALVCVTYFDDGGAEIDTDSYLATFQTGAEAFRINYVVPQGTATVNVEIDNTTETFPICNDVDFYQVDGLEPATDYAVTVIGGVQPNCEPNCAILGWWNKNGEQVFPVATNYPAAQLSVITDANGRIRFSVSGHGDENFDGLLDNWVEPVERNVGTPGYTPPPVHGCCTCYTIKVEWNKKITGEGGPTGGDGSDTMLMLANGDLNVDGGVDVIDLAILLNNWGWTAP